LDLLVGRLNQLRQWIRDDERIVEVIDSYLGEQIKEMRAHLARQNLRLALLFTMVSGAALGWIISLLGTPATVLHAFGL
jgi:hypothetical protein